MSVNDTLVLSESELGAFGEDTVPAVEEGRRAWSSVGKDNGTTAYQYVPDMPWDGDQAERDVNYQAVNLGVLQIQRRCRTYRFPRKMIFDGRFGPRTAEAVRFVQALFELVVDGQAGPRTCRAMFHPYFARKAAQYEVPLLHLWGTCVWESGADPGAVGGVTPRDRGLGQINMDAHPAVLVTDAFYLPFAATWMATNLAQARVLFGHKTPELQDACAIAYHKSPRSAREWYEAGEPPNELIAEYVDHVIESGDLV